MGPRSKIPFYLDPFGGLCAALFFALLFASGCLFSKEQIPDIGTVFQPEPSPSTTGATACSFSSFPKGFGVSPQGFPASYSALLEFYNELAALKDASVMWNGAWRDDAVLGEDSGIIPAGATSIHGEATSRCITPVLVFGWRSGTTLLIQTPANTLNDWTNPLAKTQFKAMIEAFVKLKKPPYVFLGNENDFYFEQNPTDYANWISFYNILYDAIKLQSPTTLVGPVFNFEHLSGTGTLNGWTVSRWGALDLHNLSKIDVLGLTVYPFFSYASASQIPSTYLNSLFSRIGTKPIAITETGWPAETSLSPAPAWNSSEQDQLDYISRFFSLISGQNVKLAQWLFLYGMSNDGSSQYQQWGNVALKSSTGIKRPAYAAWVEK